jgi:hypothetical protein
VNIDQARDGGSSIADEPPAEPYVPNEEATTLLRKYAANPTFYRINKYAASTRVDRLTETQKQFVPETTRYMYYFGLPRVNKSDIAVAEYAAMQVAKAMTARTMFAVDTLSCRSLWGSAARYKFPKTKEEWEFFLEVWAGRNKSLDRENFVLVMNPTRASDWAQSKEVVEWLNSGVGQRMADVMDQRNPNRKYGLHSRPFGIKTVVENAIKVDLEIEPKRQYVWPRELCCVLYVPHEHGDPFDATLRMSMEEEMTVEQKSDRGRVVEDYSFIAPNSRTGCLLV